MKTKNMKTKTNRNILVVHHIDLDGITSGYIMKRMLEQHETYLKDLITELEVPIYNVNVNYVSYNYGKDSTVDKFLDIEFLKQESIDFIYFIDVTPPIKWLQEISSYNIDIYVRPDVSKDSIQNLPIHTFIIDHHKSVWENFNSSIVCNLLIDDIIYHNNFVNILNIGNVNFTTITRSKIYYLFDETICGAKLLYDNYTLILNKTRQLLIEDNKYHNSFELPKFKNPDLTELVDLVDSYDTWKWYGTEENNYNDRVLYPLYLNEYFLKVIDIKSSTVLSDYYDLMFVESLRNILNIGSSIYKDNLISSQKEKHQIITVNNNKFVIINNKANFYSTENVIQKINSDENEHKQYSKDIVGVLYYNDIEFNNNKVNLSLRGIDKSFDCSRFMSILSDGNGGGHHSAAGCGMQLDRFIQIINEYNQEVI